MRWRLFWLPRVFHRLPAGLMRVLLALRFLCGTRCLNPSKPYSGAAELGVAVGVVAGAADWVAARAGDGAESDWASLPARYYSPPYYGNGYDYGYYSPAYYGDYYAPTYYRYGGGGYGRSIYGGYWPGYRRAYIVHR